MHARAFLKLLDRLVDNMIESGVDPNDVPVSIQIDREDMESVCADDTIEAVWDNNTCATGLVISGWIPAEDLPPKPKPFPSCCDSGHNFQPLGRAYLKPSGEVGPFGPTYAQGKSYRKLFCSKCGETREVQQN